MKKNWKSMAAAVALGMCMATVGCGGSSKEMTMTDVFSQKKTSVWYLCGDSAKDDIVSCIVIEDGEATIYWGGYWAGESHLTLGDVAKMTDADIISHVKEDAEAISTDALSFSVKTDDTGNEVVSEWVNLHDIIREVDHSDFSDGHWVVAYTPIEEPFQIFDAYFDGYVYEKGGGQYDTYLVTKTDSKTDYVLNQSGDDGVEVE